ncbi:MAG: hypothetical protein LBR33_10420 [Propionibacteriaceae bacterium]|jgi:hypothetical protein|nr:hypothetical protein [Propionibacteriaceae bacterium]
MLHALIGFAEIVALMLVMAVGLFGLHKLQNRPPRGALPAAAPAPAVTAAPANAGLAPELLAAVTVAVADYARRAAAPAGPGGAVGVPAPVSRWAASGRSFHQPT